MTTRFTFLAIIGFWLTMNVLLWRTEFGAHAGDTPVPLQLVWRKILTAPDASSLSVYQKGDRMGYCELSTGVGQQMATYDEDRPPSDTFTARAGYQIHVAGNVALGDFTNRLKFDGRVQFTKKRQWQELNFKITSRQIVLEIHSIATNQFVHVRFSNEGTLILQRDFTFADLQNPSAIIRALTGNFADGLFGAAELPALATAGVQKIEWQANRTRVKIGTEPVPVYRLETSLLGRDITVDVSTLGEIMCVQLPGDITARIDEWNKP